MPEAVPAACGRTLTAPASALGIINPLPIEMMICGTKMIAGPPPGNAMTSAHSATAPKSAISVPHQIMRSTPSTADHWAAMKFPAM